jgi:hypothetical protein
MTPAEVIAAHGDRLLALTGVVGVGEGLDADGRSCIRVLVRDGSPAIVGRLPASLEGYAVVIDVSGPLRAQRMPSGPAGGRGGASGGRAPSSDG